MLTVEMRTHPGSRSSNQDCVLWDPQLSLMAIADGMGGHKAGQVASRVALDSAQDFLRRSMQSTDLTWVYGLDAALSLTANRLINAVKLANGQIFRAGAERSEYNGMGTTVVMALAEGRRLSFVSVGDSRLYSLVGGTLRQLTRDDSWVAMISAETGVDVKDLKAHPMNHVLTNVVGARPDLDVHVDELELQDGETLMLCTDGVHGVLSEQVIRQILEETADVEAAAERLIQSALDNNSQDNVTVLVARYREAA